MGFFSRLEARALEINSLLCVGLDPHTADLAAPTTPAVEEFCMRLIDATANLAVAFKPNIAFFEDFGPEGLAVLQQVIRAVPEGIPVILDAKRGDIASSAQAYARAAFQVLGAQAITINPYLGYDAIEPFIQDPDHGVFLLCKTSNPGASDLQDLLVGSSSGISTPAGALTLYEVVAKQALERNRNDNLGLVVGATQPEALQRVRAMAPDLWILAPGVGVQGGDLQAAVHAGLRRDGSGVLFPVSRGISQSKDPRRSAAILRDQINLFRAEGTSRGLTTEGRLPEFNPQLSALADALLDAGCVKFGQFTLKSGLQSPIYIDMRQLVGFPSLLNQVAVAYLPVLRELSFDRLAALPYAALPIATTISLLGGWPLVYPRKEAKSYGTRADIEGPYNAGECVIVIDDLATTGGSKFEAIEKLAAGGLKVTDIVVLIDRQSGAAQSLAESGYCLHAVFTLSKLLDYWERKGRVSQGEIAAVRGFLSGHPQR